MKYRFTSDAPLVFSDLSYGPGVTVERATKSDPDVEGATVVLNKGDILTVDSEITHAWLKVVDEPQTPKTPRTPKAPKAPKKPETVKAVTPLPVETPPAVPSTPAIPTEGQ